MNVFKYHTPMKKFYHIILISLAFYSIQIQARNNTTQIEDGANYIQKKDFDQDLIVYLYDKINNPIQCTRPERNGNFLFTELTDGKYCIVVVNVNGYESERYCVVCTNGQIYTCLNNVLRAENLIPTNSSFEYYSCETKSDLNLSLSPSPLKNKGDIQFTVKKQENVLLIISNDKGDKIRMIPVGELKPGIHSVGFDTTGLKGTYQVAAQAGKEQSTCTIQVK